MELHMTKQIDSEMETVFFSVEALQGLGLTCGCQYGMKDCNRTWNY